MSFLQIVHLTRDLFVIAPASFVTNPKYFHTQLLIAESGFRHLLRLLVVALVVAFILLLMDSVSLLSTSIIALKIKIILCIIIHVLTIII